ncbi:MAG: ATP-binding protein [Ilumatobacteraceae bacterium]
MSGPVSTQVVDLRRRPWIVAAAGIALTALIEGVIIATDPEITRAVPLLLLMVPITAASVLGGWRASVPVALVSGMVYSLSFLAPRGVVRIGLTEDTIAIVTFVAVAVLVSLLAGLAGSQERRRDQQRAVLLRSVSHDLRNPLATIRAASAELRDGLVTDPSQRSELLDIVVAESDRLDRIVANMLSLSRVEAGMLAPDREPEELAEIVDEAVRRVTARRSSVVTVDVPDDLPDVDVDRTQIDQVVTNLVENALRHGAKTPVTVTARPAGEWVEVSVADGGPGFSEEARRQAFEPFRAVGPSGMEGVGLAVCKAIVEAHGGTIALGEQPGGGARVSFTVPQA